MKKNGLRKKKFKKGGHVALRTDALKRLECDPLTSYAHDISTETIAFIHSNSHLVYYKANNVVISRGEYLERTP